MGLLHTCDCVSPINYDLQFSHNHMSTLQPLLPKIPKTCNLGFLLSKSCWTLQMKSRLRSSILPISSKTKTCGSPKQKQGWYEVKMVRWSGIFLGHHGGKEGSSVPKTNLFKVNKNEWKCILRAYLLWIDKIRLTIWNGSTNAINRFLDYVKQGTVSWCMLSLSTRSKIGTVKRSKSCTWTWYFPEGWKPTRSVHRL